MTKASLVRDEGVAGSNPATPTKFPENSAPSPDSFPDRYREAVERVNRATDREMAAALSHLRHMSEVRPAGLDKDAAHWAIGTIADLTSHIAALVEIVRTSPCPYNGRATGVTVGECQQCGCSGGLLIKPLPARGVSP